MAKKATKVTYENNPFFIATSGITLLFTLAQGVAVMFIIFSVIGLIGNMFTPSDGASSNSSALSTTVQSWSASEWMLLISAVGIIGLAVAMIAALFGGVSAYTSAKLAHGEEVAIGSAFREAFDRLWSFLWLQIIILVKTFLWTLLFIVPGIIMAVRYSLASVAFFDETKDLKGNAAVKESLRLTKGAWLTTFAANALFNMLTFGAIGSVLSIGTNAVLYRQYQASGKTKPAAHILSWLTLILPFVLLILGFFFLVILGVVIGLAGQHTSP